MWRVFIHLLNEDTAKVIRETVMESELEVTDINVKELLIFLRKNMSSSEIENSNFKEYIPTRRKKVKGMKSSEKYDLKLS